MAFQVVNADDEAIQRHGQRRGHRGSHQQRAGQPGALGVGNGIDGRQRSLGVGHDLLQQRHQPLDVIT